MKILSVVAVDYFHLVEPLEYFYLVNSMEYSYLVESFEYFDLVESFEKFPVKNISSFRLRILNIVAVCLYLAHSSLRNVRNTMTRHKQVGVIRQPFRSGKGREDRIEFVHCVEGWEPQIHELWSFAKDGITREVHPFTGVNVGDLSGDCFQTHYMTEEARRVTIFFQKSINASIEWLGTPVHFYDTVGVP